jgi:lipopolysaccharide/colanic/teichoic acid biosynthesis glycosyltransferase
MTGARIRIERGAEAVNLLGCIAAFEVAYWSWSKDAAVFAVALSAWPIQGLIAGMTTAVGMALAAGRDELQLGVDRLCRAFGLTVATQYAIAYFVHVQPMPWLVTAAACAVSVALVTLSPRRVRQCCGGVLFMGGGLPAPLRAALGPHVEAAFTTRAAMERQPGRILVNTAAERSPIAPRELLQFAYAGVAVDSVSAVYEDVLCRVWPGGPRAGEFLFAAASRSKVGLATQAVYTNLIGLALLMAIAPLLAMVALLIALFAGAGPVLETTECLGFQQIPFSLLRFRTRRPNGSISSIGRALIALRITNLPGLINVVRGEMAFFGPPPVRKCFADVLCRETPGYLYRFMAKPGLMGWSQLHLAECAQPPDAMERLEFDLYYVKHQSASFDAEILLRTILRRPYAPAVRAASPEVTGIPC